MNFLRNLLGANQGENPRQDQPGGIEPHNLPLNRTREQRVSVSGGKAPPFHVLPEDTHAMIIYWENEVYCDTLVQGASFKKPKGYPKHLIKNQVCRSVYTVMEYTLILFQRVAVPPTAYVPFRDIVL